MPFRPAFAVVVFCALSLAGCSVEPEGDAVTRRFGPFSVTTDAWTATGSAAKIPRATLTPIEVDTESLINAFDDAEGALWAGAHQGTWLRSLDEGATWEVGVVAGHEERQFRDVAAFGPDEALLMSAGTGDESRILRTEDGGTTWSQVFVMDHPEGFLDCMAVWEDGRGIAYGDAVDGELYLLRTEDRGRTWTRIADPSLPPALEGEGGFAASGTCAFAREGGNGFVVTGAAAVSRLLVTEDFGASWFVDELPVDAGPSRGAATVAMRADGPGFVMGGTIGRGAQGVRVARTFDHGQTWFATDRLTMDGAVYGSTLAGRSVVAVGPDGLAFSLDLGETWTRGGSETLWAAHLLDDRTGFAGGPRGRLVRIDLELERVEQQPGDLVIQGGRIFEATGSPMRPNPGVLVRDGVIMGLGAMAPGRGVEVIELEDDETLLPGLFDVHAHYAVDLFGEGRVDETRVQPVLFLANGVTSTFPGGEVDPPAFDEAVAAIDAGERPGPRIHRSGAYFGSARPGWLSWEMTEDSIRAEVDYWAARGVTGFKAKGIRPEQLRPLVEQAATHGLPVTGHLGSGARGSVNPRDAIEMGMARIEHFLGGDALPNTTSAYNSLEDLDVDDPETRRALLEQIDRFVSNEVFFDATLTAYEYYGNQEEEVFADFADERSFLTPYAFSQTEGYRDRTPNEQFAKIYRVKQETLRLFVENGGAPWLTTGTDHPSWGQFFSGFSIHREMHAMVRAGVDPEVVLRAATINGARSLRVDDRLGSIEPGKLADFVVVHGDPVMDIRVTRNVQQVIKGGVSYDPDELLESVRGTLGPGSEAEADWWKGNARLTPDRDTGEGAGGGTGAPVPAPGD